MGKVICKGQGQIYRLHFSKNGRLRGIRVSQTHLVFSSFLTLSQTSQGSVFTYHSKNAPSLVLQIFLHLETVENNSTSGWLNHMV